MKYSKGSLCISLSCSVCKLHLLYLVLCALLSLVFLNTGRSHSFICFTIYTSKEQNAFSARWQGHCAASRIQFGNKQPKFSALDNKRTQTCRTLSCHPESRQRKVAATTADMVARWNGRGKSCCNIKSQVAEKKQKFSLTTNATSKRCYLSSLELKAEREAATGIVCLQAQKTLESGWLCSGSIVS